MKEIKGDALRSWFERGHPVAGLDVRPARENMALGRLPENPVEWEAGANRCAIA